VVLTTLPALPGTLLMVFVFNRDDEEFVQSAATFLAHIALCPDCQKIAKSGDGRQAVKSIFHSLALIGAHDLSCPDYAGAVDFCRKWLRSFGLTPEIDAEHIKSSKHEKSN